MSCRKLCLKPTLAYLLGMHTCKDGIKSRMVCFSRSEAFQHYLELGLGLAVAESMVCKYTLELPCGHCAACLLNKRLDWSTRLTHEMSVFGQDVCFITLTYNEDKLPRTDDAPYIVDGVINPRKQFDWLHGTPTLCIRDVQLFFKRLRKSLPGRRIRYYVVGEYGPSTHRPHYHALIFGWRPGDMVFFKMIKGHPVFRSAHLEKCWPSGFSTVEDVTPGVAKYCAQYVTKKMIVKNEAPNIQPEFYRQSVRNGGIGASWVKCWYRDLLEHPFVTFRNGKFINKAPIPKYYITWLRKNRPGLWEVRRDKVAKYYEENPKPPVTLDERQEQLKSIEKNLYDTSCQLRQRVL